MKTLKTYIWVLPVTALVIGSIALFSGSLTAGAGSNLALPDGAPVTGLTAPALNSDQATLSSKEWTPTAVVPIGSVPREPALPTIFPPPKTTDAY